MRHKLPLIIILILILLFGYAYFFTTIFSGRGRICATEVTHAENKITHNCKSFPSACLPRMYEESGRCTMIWALESSREIIKRCETSEDISLCKENVANMTRNRCDGIPIEDQQAVFEEYGVSSCDELAHIY